MSPQTKGRLARLACALLGTAIAGSIPLGFIFPVVLTAWGVAVAAAMVLMFGALVVDWVWNGGDR